MAGDRGDDLAGVQRTKRSGVNGTTVSSSRGTRSRPREGIKARDPRARERAAVVVPTGNAGVTWLFRVAMKAQPWSLHWQAHWQDPGPQSGATLRVNERRGWRREHGKDGRLKG